MAYHPQTYRQVEWFNRMLKTMIAKFMNGRQDNATVNLWNTKPKMYTRVGKNVEPITTPSALRKWPCFSTAEAAAVAKGSWGRKRCEEPEDMTKFALFSCSQEKWGEVGKCPPIVTNMPHLWIFFYHLHSQPRNNHSGNVLFRIFLQVQQKSINNEKQRIS